jgi:hypothetical protein
LSARPERAPWQNAQYIAERSSDQADDDSVALSGSRISADVKFHGVADGDIIALSQSGYVEEHVGAAIFRRNEAVAP